MPAASTLIPTLKVRCILRDAEEGRSDLATVSVRPGVSKSVRRWVAIFVCIVSTPEVWGDARFTPLSFGTFGHHRRGVIPRNHAASCGWRVLGAKLISPRKRRIASTLPQGT
jgi:hypothetical protein